MVSYVKGLLVNQHKVKPLSIKKAASFTSGFFYSAPFYYI
jgi:hypothetical protein